MATSTRRSTLTSTILQLTVVPPCEGSESNSTPRNSTRVAIDRDLLVLNGTQPITVFAAAAGVASAICVCWTLCTNDGSRIATSIRGKPHCEKAASYPIGELINSAER